MIYVVIDTINSTMMNQSESLKLLRAQVTELPQANDDNYIVD